MKREAIVMIEQHYWEMEGQVRCQIVASRKDDGSTLIAEVLLDDGEPTGGYIHTEALYLEEFNLKMLIAARLAAAKEVLDGFFREPGTANLPREEARQVHRLIMSIDRAFNEQFGLIEAGKHHE